MGTTGLAILTDRAALARDLLWMTTGACGEVDPGLFYPAKPSKEGIAQAKAVCAGCPVRARCLERVQELEKDLGSSAAQNKRLRHGIWGGTTPSERWRDAYPEAVREYRQKENATRVRRRKAKREAREAEEATAA